MADFTAGPRNPTPLAVAGQHLAMSICYEDAFGGEMRGQLPAATLLVNVSNDAWFGESLAAEQHWQIAQMRSLESGRMMLRANNTGATVGSQVVVDRIFLDMDRCVPIGLIVNGVLLSQFVSWVVP